MSSRDPKKLEAFQRGRKNELEAVIGKQIAAVHDIGQDEVELLFVDGTKLQISGQSMKSPTAIYYKVIDTLTDEEKEEIKQNYGGFVNKISDY